MKITVNGKELEVSGQEPLIVELRKAGYDIPSLCFSQEAQHQPSCMVCAVRNEANGKMIPSCGTFPTEGMVIDALSDEVTEIRKMSLELLLSDHRADCEAPCTIVCPSHIDVAQLLLYYDRGEMNRAFTLLSAETDVTQLPCSTCKAPCEKACRRGRIDEIVSIRAIINEIAAHPAQKVAEEATSIANISKETFSSRISQYNDAEKAWLKEEYSQPSRCLHCACEGRAKCKLRAHATAAHIKASRYGVDSRLPVKVQQHIVGNLYYEPAKCVRCGLCVYNTKDGFTFKHRGFDMEVVIAEQCKQHVNEDIARLCPTGALYLREIKEK